MWQQFSMHASQWQGQAEAVSAVQQLHCTVTKTTWLGSADTWDSLPELPDLRRSYIESLKNPDFKKVWQWLF